MKFNTKNAKCCNSNFTYKSPCRADCHHSESESQCSALLKETNCGMIKKAIVNSTENIITSLSRIVILNTVHSLGLPCSFSKNTTALEKAWNRFCTRNNSVTSAKGGEPREHDRELKTMKRLKKGQMGTHCSLCFLTEDLEASNKASSECTQNK